jgi:hypothetical protein
MWNRLPRRWKINQVESVIQAELHFAEKHFEVSAQGLLSCLNHRAWHFHLTQRILFATVSRRVLIHKGNAKSFSGTPGPDSFVKTTTEISRPLI